MLRTTTLLAWLALAGGAQAQDMIRGEYFIDQDNGVGSSTNTSFDIVDAPTATLSMDIATTGFAPGVHTIGIRTLDGNARWSHTNFTALVITEPTPAIEDLAQVEYFLNEDPGWGQGHVVWAGTTPDLQAASYIALLDGATEGVHTLFIRSRTADGRWGHTNHIPLVVIAPPEPLADIDRIETFWISGEVDPGFGLALGEPISTPDIDFIDIAFNRPQLPGFSWDDTLAVRTRDANGRWSHTNFIEVTGSTSTEELAAKAGISVYPNPFAEQLTVRPSDDQPLRVILYDPQGKLVVDRMVHSETVLDLANQASGMYTAFFWKDLKVIHRVTLVKR